MNTTNKKQQFSFDLFKMKFDCTNPGKETKSHLFMVLLFYLIVIVFITLSIHFLHFSMGDLAIPFFGSKAISWGKNAANSIKELDHLKLNLFAALVFRVNKLTRIKLESAFKCRMKRVFLIAILLGPLPPHAPFIS